ncbi:SET domain-containing protein-lysine N-methyltransferase [Ferruginibacter sp.]|nr:SET domain-containing protein-lysine N-methyltransferase [Ferruginibacter sp.]
MLQPYLYIDKTENTGRGVFTDEDIPQGTLIEIAPVIVMSKADRVHLDKTKLHDYIFEWGEEKDKCCMALGLIPMYNHSYTSNCEYLMDFEEEIIFVKTVCSIQKGTELTINYNGDYNDNTKVWFNAL